MNALKASILSLNVGHPQEMRWGDKSIVSSMLKTPVPGPLTVGPLNIEGDSFKETQYHGTPDSVLYAYAVDSAMEFMKLLGRNKYIPGSLGENLTLDHFDETKIAVGDIFQIGEVTAQATYPRIPCGKVNIRMEHPKGQKLMNDSGRSGVYFRILKPGKIHGTDQVIRTSEHPTRLLISDVYQWTVTKTWTREARIKALDQGLLPQRILTKLRLELS